MKSRLVVLALGAIASLLVGVAASSARPTEDVTLRLFSNASFKPQFDAIIANYGRVKPNVKIDITYAAATAFGPQLLTELQAGNAADLLSIQAGAPSAYGLYALGSQGKLLDLSGSPWQKRIVPAARKYLKVKERYYGAPTAYTTSGIVYNVDLFKSLGLTVPTTFAQLIANCKKSAAAGKPFIALGMGDLAGQINLTNGLIASLVYAEDPDWTLKRIQHKVTFAGSTLWNGLVNSIMEMKDSGCFQPNPAGVKQVLQYTMVATGQAVGMPATNGEITALQQINANVKLNQFPWPARAAKNTRGLVANSALVLAVNKATSHTAEAKDFVNFVMRPKQNDIFNKIGNTLSGEQIRTGNVPSVVSDYSSYLKAGKVMYSAVAGWPRPDKGMFIPQFLAQATGLFTGQTTPSSVLKYMDDLWDRP